MEKISVIVPVYKVEQYLNRCIRSIVDQTYQNLEIILVDDGSPDNCGAMCDLWAQKDPRIKVIHKENGGSGAARNTALDAATGDYIAFVDSDDYICPEMLQHLLQLLKDGADIAECGYRNTDNDFLNFDTSHPQISSFDPENAMLLHIRDKHFRQIIWNKLYSRNVIGDIRFVDGKKIDDEFWTYRVLGNAKKLIQSSKVCYAYRQQNTSAMHSMSVQNHLQVLEAKVLRHEYIKESFPALASESLIILWQTCLYQAQCVLSQLKDDKKEQALRFIMDILNKHPISGEVFSECSAKQKLWFSAAKRNLTGTCRIRNFLRIGF